jgi:hypothetical protein
MGDVDDLEGGVYVVMQNTLKSVKKSIIINIEFVFFDILYKDL